MKLTCIAIFYSRLCCLHRCRSRQFVGAANDILPEFPQICQKNFLATNFPTTVWLLMNSHKVKHKLLETVWWLFILYVWCVFYHIVNFYLYTDTITKTYNFIHCVKNCTNFCAQFFWDFARIFNKSNIFGMQLHRLHPPLLHHWLFVPTVSSLSMELHSSLSQVRPFCDLCCQMWVVRSCR